MALFKIFKGTSANLPTTMVDGYCYFTTDDGQFYIDYLDSDGVTLKRKPISGPGQSIEYIVGTQTAATGSWAGITKDSALVAGKTIAYKLPYAGSGNASLTLTFTNPAAGDPANSGAIPVYINTSRTTTHYGAGSVVIMTYDGTNWRTTDYWNSNDTTTTYARFANGAFAPITSLYRYQLLLSHPTDSSKVIPANTTSNTTGTTKATITTESFNPFDYIYYYNTTGTVSANTNISVSYVWYGHPAVDLRYSFNTGSTLVANKDIYLVAKLQSDGTAKLRNPGATGANASAQATGNDAGPVTQILPSTEDGYIYIKIGHAYDTYRMVLTFNHPIYVFKDGGIRPYSYFTDENVEQIIQTDNAEHKILITTSDSPTSGESTAVGYGENLAYNPSLNRLSTGNLRLTGELDVTGNAYLHNQTAADSLTAGSLLVTGNANFTQSPTAPTPASTSNDTTVATTEFVKSRIAAGVTGVKGNAESSYRVGNVNLTPANIGALALTGGTLTGTLNISVGSAGYTDSLTAGGLNLNNSNIYGLNSIYTADASDNASEGIHFYRDSTHVDTLWMSGGNIYFVPNRATGTGTTAANSEKVTRLPASITTGRAVYTDGTTGKLAISSVTSTELGYLSGVTSAIQTQLNAKAPLASPALTGTPTAPTAAAGTNTTQIATTAFVTNAVAQGFVANDAMVFKGLIGSNQTITQLPTSGYNAGWTYRVADAGTFAGEYCEVGDLLIAINDGPASGSSVINTDWGKVEHNIDGAVFRGSGASNSSVGSSTQPVYVNGSGIVTAITGAIANDTTGNAATATVASKLSNTTKIGDTNKPVYFTANGVPAAISYTIDKSVPSNAVFTDRYVNSATFADDSTNTTASPVKMTLTRAGSDTATVTANIPKVSSSSAGVAPKGAAVSSQSQSTKFLREDGTWAAPSYTTNTNTTYTFTDGTDGSFSVTPSGGSAQTVSIGKPATAGTADVANSVAWGNVTGKPSSFTPSSHTHYELATQGDNRGVATTPNDYANRLVFRGLKTNSSFGSPSTDTYSYVVGLRGWSDSSGGNAHELAFNNTGIYWRSGATTSWGNWYRIYTTGNKPTASDVGLGNVTNHQQVHEVAWDSTNKKITRSKNGTAGDVVQFIAGSNITLTAESGKLTIASSYTNSRDPGYGKIKAGGISTATTAITANTATATASTYNETLTINPGNKWVAVAASNSDTAGSDTFTIGHALSGVTAGTTSPNTAQTPGFNATFNIPTVTFDAAGHITSTGTTTVKIPAQTRLSKTDSGSGNAVTAITVSNHAITVTKGDTFVNLSSAQTISGTKTFSAIQKFTNTTDSSHSTDTAAAVSISGGLSVAKKVSAKEVRIDNNQTSKGVSLQYDESLEVLNFVFS